MIRRVIAIALVFALAACSARPEPRRHRRMASGRPLRIVVLGDSLAFGTGASDPRNALGFRIYRALERDHPGSDVRNFAIGGTRAADVLRLEVPRLRPASADLVVLIVGGNDVIARTPAARFATEDLRLVNAVRAREPRAALVIFGVPDIAASPLFAQVPAIFGLAERDDRRARAIAIAAGATYIDLFALSRRFGAVAGFLSADDFHPSDAGYAKLADAALPAIARAVALSGEQK